MTKTTTISIAKDPLILVTGAAGLIGSTIIWTLNKMGYKRIIAVDHLSTGEKWQNLRSLNILNYYEKKDFRELLAADNFSESFQIIFHLGACSDTTEVDASYLADNNFAYSKMLSLYALRHKSRMIYASSAATYGDGSNGFKDDENTIYKLRPLNKYGYSKQIFDQYLLHNNILLNKENEASFIGVKYSNVFGPNEYHKAQMRSMILRSFEQITSTGKVKLFKSYMKEYGDGEQVRDFLYSKDAAKMTIFFMHEGRDLRGLYNIGIGYVRTWNDLAKATFMALHKKSKIEYIEMPEELKVRYQYYTCLDMSKYKNAGYKEEPIILENAIKDYVRYLKKDSHLGDLDNE